MTITKRQRQVMDAIEEFVRRNGFTPSFDEIRQALGLNSLATVHKHLDNLQLKGLIYREFNRSRSMELTRSGKRALKTSERCCPKCGFNLDEKQSVNAEVVNGLST